MPRFRYALLGAGSVGTAVAELLQRAGHEPIGVASRSESSARAAARRLGTRALTLGSLGDADAILVGTPATAFAALAAELSGIVTPETVLWHLSGAYGTAPLASSGARVAALHPVQACPTTDLAVRRLPGSAWGVTCTQGLRDWAHDVVRSLEGTPVDVAEEDRAVWHAASVITSNGAAALMASGERILQSIGIDDPYRVLGPLAAGTIQNAIEAGGGAATLTGPVVRGEVDTVRLHLDSLDEGSRDAYVNASRSILDTARRAERIDPATAERMDEVLR